MSAQSFKAIRARLGLTQADLAVPLGVTQGNISFYEKGQTVPPPVAALLIEFAKSKGVATSYDEIYAADQIDAAESEPAKSGA